MDTEKELGGGRHVRRKKAARTRATAAFACAMAAVLAVAVIVLSLSSGSPRNGPSSGPGSAHTKPPVAGSERGVPRAGADAASVHGGVPVDPGAFSTGACVAYAPTDGDNHHTVFIDAGHGGIDPGGRGVTETGTVIYEAPENLDVALSASRLLRAKGFRVVLSRDTSTVVLRPRAGDMTPTQGVLSVQGARDDVAARDQCANDAKATVLVGIYMDAGASPANAGCLTAYDPGRPFAADSERLASLLQRDVLARMNAYGWQIPDDGAQPDSTLGGEPLTTTAAGYDHLLLLGPAVPGWFTTPSEMPGALIEPLFVSDPFEGSIANSASGHQAIARGMAEAIEQYFRR